MPYAIPSSTKASSIGSTFALLTLLALSGEALAQDAKSLPASSITTWYTSRQALWSGIGLSETEARLSAARALQIEINATIAGRALVRSNLGQIIVENDGAVHVRLSECKPNPIATAALLLEIERQWPDISGRDSFEREVASLVADSIQKRGQRSVCKAERPAL